MTFLSELMKAIHKEHSSIRSEPFIRRYMHWNITLSDHYRNLRQVLAIYKAMENKLSDPECALKIPDEFNFLKRSKEIEKDLAFMSKRLMYAKKDDILPATQTYIDTYIKPLDPSKDSLKIFGHFITRSLGDLFFGGQEIKEQVRDMYKREKLYSIKQPNAGLNLYLIDVDKEIAKHELEKWLNGVGLHADTGENARCCISQHKLIFGELEKTRPGQCSRFFSPKIVAAAGTMAVVGLAAGFAYRNM